MNFVTLKNSIHKESRENWAELLKKYWFSDVKKLYEERASWPAGSAYWLLSIYNELMADERLHSCKELGLYVIPKLLEVISYTIPHQFKWEKK